MRYKVRVPCSSANLGPGYDVLGLALQMYLEVEFESTDGGLHIENVGEGADILPTTESHLVYKMMCRYAGEAKPEGVRLRVQNEIPLGRGFGSSAAALVAGVALGLWLREGKTPARPEVLRVAALEEGHPDNVAPAVYGGLTAAAMVDEEVLASRLQLSDGIRMLALIPDYELSTEKARKVLPSQISRTDAIFNLQRMGILLAGLACNRKDWLKAGVEDKLHQQYRASLMPGAKEVLEALDEHPDCHGAYVSGAGPSLVSFVARENTSMLSLGVARFREAGVEAVGKILAPDDQGLQMENLDEAEVVTQL